jgi:hypothetical protein
MCRLLCAAATTADEEGSIFRRSIAGTQATPSIKKADCYSNNTNAFFKNRRRIRMTRATVVLCSSAAAIDFTDMALFRHITLHFWGSTFGQF